MVLCLQQPSWPRKPGPLPMKDFRGVESGNSLGFSRFLFYHREQIVCVDIERRTAGSRTAGFGLYPPVLEITNNS